jgi:hypothetical protein
LVVRNLLISALVPPPSLPRTRWWVGSPAAALPATRPVQTNVGGAALARRGSELGIAQWRRPLAVRGRDRDER